jgi:hypothetical protein
MKRRDLLWAGTALAGAIATPTVAVGAVANSGRMVQLDDGLKGYFVTPRRRGRVPAVTVLMEAFGLNGYIK